MGGGSKYGYSGDPFATYGKGSGQNDNAGGAMAQSGPQFETMPPVPPLDLYHKQDMVKLKTQLKATIFKIRM